MRTASVVEGGIQTTVQDYPGRRGMLAQGFFPAGPMDHLAHRAANLLVGNPESAATLEITLGNFRLRVKARESEIARRRLDATQKLAEQQKLMLEARRRCRLLERLKERRLTEWTAGRDHELEEIAAESYLARWNRGRVSDR